MLAVRTTVIAVVAPDGAADPLEAVRAANVRVVRSDPEAPAFERYAHAWEQAPGTSSPYLLHDADPLAAVAEAWARRFEGTSVAGDLEVAVSSTLARWRARSLELPDYYIVVAADEMRPTLRHWFLGLLGSAAPTRVVAARPDMPLVDQLTRLRPGPWWPALDRLLADVDRVVPEQASPLAAVAPAPALVRPDRPD